MSGNVVVVGGANIDIVAAPSAPLKEHDSNPGHSTISFGGVGRNIAENLSRLGCRVQFVSVFGDDMFSHTLLNDLERKNIDVSLCKTIRGRSCSKYICINSDKGELIAAINDMSLYDHMHAAITDESIAAMNEADVVVLDANTSEELLEKITLKCSTPIAFDAVSISKIPRCRNILDKLFIFKPNLYEAEELCKLLEPENDAFSGKNKFSDEQPDTFSKASYLSRILRNKGVKNVMISLGKEGIYYENASKYGIVPSLATDIVNTSGCGDTFLAGAVKGYLEGGDIEAMAKYGSAAAAICAASEETVSGKLSPMSVAEVLNRVNAG
ncbi:MAG: carbohydrate kinase family protein [Lachnospiraceae bacterium]|nr:carbohydrate kinase family protein [Lachnospiraceae bacterium]